MIVAKERWSQERLKKTDDKETDPSQRMQRYACVAGEGAPVPCAPVSWPCEEEHMADALALRADERRDKLRKAPGRSKYPTIRGCLNGETRLRGPQPSARQ